MKTVLILLLLVSYSCTHTLLYVHEGWRYTIVLDKEQSSIIGAPCTDCNEDGWECEELPPDFDDDRPPTRLQPGAIVLISLTAVLFVLMLVTATAVIAYKYSMRKHLKTLSKPLIVYT